MDAPYTPEALLASEIRALAEDYSDKETAQQFLARLEDGNLTRDNNAETHFCLYFCPYDSDAKQVFIGHHKKSGLWLFNGGHINKDERLRETLHREMQEEMGLGSQDFQISEPRLLTVTPITESAIKIPCKVHYDLWYFIPVDKNSFHPDAGLLATEFHTIDWMDMELAKTMVTQPNTRKALEVIEDYFF